MFRDSDEINADIEPLISTTSFPAFHLWWSQKVLRALLREHRGALASIELLPLSRSEIVEREIANTHSNQAQCGMADSGRHSPDLAILAFDKLQREPGVGDVFAKSDRWVARRHGRRRRRKYPCLAWAGAIASEIDPSRGQLRQGIGEGHPFDLCPILAAMTMLGIEQS